MTSVTNLPNRNGFIKNEKGVKTYFFSGHIHPGIRIDGAGRQSLYFPCFYFGKKYAVLPAFSRFTGAAVIYPECRGTGLCNCKSGTHSASVIIKSVMPA